MCVFWSTWKYQESDENERQDAFALIQICQDDLQAGYEEWWSGLLRRGMRDDNYRTQSSRIQPPRTFSLLPSFLIPSNKHCTLINHGCEREIISSQSFNPYRSFSILGPPLSLSFPPHSANENSNYPPLFLPFSFSPTPEELSHVPNAQARSMRM